MAGSDQYRTSWAQYTESCDALLFVVDAAAEAPVIDTSRRELHNLLEEGALDNMVIRLTR